MVHIVSLLDKQCPEYFSMTWGSPLPVVTLQTISMWASGHGLGHPRQLPSFVLPTLRGKPPTWSSLVFCSWFAYSFLLSSICCLLMLEVILCFSTSALVDFKYLKTELLNYSLHTLIDWGQHQLCCKLPGPSHWLRTLSRTSPWSWPG